MPNITIRERDETRAGFESVATEVVYVPGFAQTNQCVYIYDGQDEKPTSDTPGVRDNNYTYNTTGTAYPAFACNITTRQTWRCNATPTEDPESGYDWREIDYIEPSPENAPVLCQTLQDFESNFGSLPYKWIPEKTITGDVETEEAFAERCAYPTFAPEATPTLGTNYAYKEGDYEKSYIYARELLTAGMPILFDNIVSRSDNEDDTSKPPKGMKEFPSVLFLYSVLRDHFEELKDKGEYTVKYITSGAYPVFECRGYTIDTTVYQGQADFPYHKDSASIVTASFGQVGGAPKIPDGVEADVANIVFNYHTYSWVESECTEVPSGQNVMATTATSAAGLGEIARSWSPVYYNLDANVQKKWTSTPSEETFEITQVVRNGNTWDVDSSFPLGGAGNSVEIVANGIKVTFANTATPDWDCTSAIVTATYQKTTPDPVESDDAFAQKMIEVASSRGDAVAIIDHTNFPARPLVGIGSVYAKVLTFNFVDGEFGTMFTPWASYSMVGEASVVPSLQIMPASYGYLSAMAKSIRNNPSWLAVAGVARGLVPYIGDLNTSRRLTNTIANSYQPRDDTSINAITNIRPYGLTIWGNRTLKHNIGNLTATSFLNTRNLISEVKKIAYITAKSLIFEQNTDVLWINFRAGITPLLDKMLSGQGLTNYKIIRKATTERAKVVAEIRLSPIDAVEDFDITVVITDDNISVS